jgi:hypothetical protein
MEDSSYFEKTIGEISNNLKKLKILRKNARIGYQSKKNL